MIRVTPRVSSLRSLPTRPCPEEQSVVSIYVRDSAAVPANDTITGATVQRSGTTIV